MRQIKTKKVMNNKLPRKGVKATQLANKGKRVSQAPRRNRVFQITGMPGYFTGGTINGDTINFTYSVVHPSIEAGLDKVRFQVIDNPDKSKIYAKNFDRVSALASEYFGIKAYCYNEIAKKASKQSVLQANTATDYNKGGKTRINLKRLLQQLLFPQIKIRRAI